ncbi:HSPB1-associated protein 1 isoform X3 [Dermacentor albipictus]|uniref:HSPB1-associated protein 1 isoform X3 n=1 Tax=Dermacentor albipictus TaxID=60249 RepID=UPI0031FDBF50
MSEIATTQETCLTNCKQPVVFRRALSSWECSSWTLTDWATKTQNVSLKFRVGIKSATGAPQWETEGTRASATIGQFSQWISGLADKRNELATVDGSSHFAYSSYNYMHNVFRDFPSVLESVDWTSFGFPGRNGADSTLWLGSEGSDTPCHQDTYGYNLVAQLIGKKSWTMFPPKDGSCLYPTRIPFEESSIFSMVNFGEVDFMTFPELQSTRPYHVVLEPGDVLLVPHHWWHYVSCLTNALSINTWIPMDTDKDFQLLEAVTRTLATALIPCYEDEAEQWVNTNEELTSPEQNLAYLQRLVQPHRMEDITPGCASPVTELPFTCVSHFNWEDYASRTGSTLLHKCHSDKRQAAGAGRDVISSRRIISCFLDPSVAEVISKRLKELIK